ncbi:MAG: ferredoxin-type protein NapF [Sneathiellales bacterium]|nr:ferredoxin-type protein NapF [Sneathiellales bacterium]
MSRQRDGVALSRRRFLSGSIRFAEKRPATERLYLPWTTPESILSACTGCEACLQACPQKIIEKTASNRPTVNFAKGDCTFCEACCSVCEAPVFTLHETSANGMRNAWALKAGIEDTCLAFKGVQCGACQDHCDPRAILFKPRLRAISTPEISEIDCTGCGACVSVCPANSIRVDEGKGREIKRE